MFDITVSSAPGAPANDDCSGAVTIVNLDTGNNQCASDGLVWYEYVFTGAGSDEVLTPTIIAGSLTTATINQVWVGGCPGDIGAVDATADLPNIPCILPGQSVFLEVGDVTPAYGDYSFDLVESDNGVNFDICSEASSLTDLTCSNSLTGAGDASACPDVEATCAGFDYGTNPTAGIWYTFNINSQIDLFDITGTAFEVFTGPDCTTLTQLGCAGDPALTGIEDNPTTTYYVLVFDGGDFTAEANPTEPTNDMCANAIALMDATLESGTTSCASPHDAAFLWFKYNR